MQATSNLLQISTVTNEAATSREQMSDGSANTNLNEKQASFVPNSKGYMPSLNSVYQSLGGLGTEINSATNPLEQTLPHLQSTKFSKQQ